MRVKIMYEQGPNVITMGIAGRFERGKAKEVDDKIAGVLLKKKTIRFKKATDSKK